MIWGITLIINSITFQENKMKMYSKNYPVSFNGKVRFQMELPLDMSKEDIEKTVLEDERTIAQIGDKQGRKRIGVPGRISNSVIG